VKSTQLHDGPRSQPTVVVGVVVAVVPADDLCRPVPARLVLNCR